MKIQRLVSPLRPMGPSKYVIGLFSPFKLFWLVDLKKKKQFMIFARVGAHQVCIDLCEVSDNKSCQIIFNLMQIIR